MKVAILLVLSSLFFATILFAGEEEAPRRFLDLKPSALPAETPKGGLTMQKEECKNGLYYNQSFDRCVIASNATSIEKAKKEVDVLKETKGTAYKNQVLKDAKKTGLTGIQPQQEQQQQQQ